MAEFIYVLGFYGFLSVSGRLWASVCWPIYIGEIAARHFLSNQGGQDREGTD